MIFSGRYQNRLLVRLYGRRAAVTLDGDHIFVAAAPLEARARLRATAGMVELYKVHEIIRDAIQPKKIHELGWADKADDSEFTGSANRADVSGHDARHARNSGPPPTRTMLLSEGRSYVSDLVTKWLELLGGNR